MLQVQLKWGLGTFINLFYLSSPFSSSFSPLKACAIKEVSFDPSLILTHTILSYLTSNVKDRMCNVKKTNLLSLETPFVLQHQAGGESKGKRDRENMCQNEREKMQGRWRLKEGRKESGRRERCRWRKKKKCPLSTSLQLKWNANSRGEQ